MEQGIPYLLEAVRNVYNAAPKEKVHPGLRFDRYVAIFGKSEQAKDAIAALQLHLPYSDNGWQRHVLARRKSWLEEVGAQHFSLQSKEPIALHLARAAVASENAALCFHPIYGFPYIPGTGLKGLARAYAETFWAPSQPDHAAAFERLEDIFGWAPGSREKTKNHRNAWVPSREELPDRPASDSTSIGSVVFHDAYPVASVLPQIDITNPHYAKYYKGEDLIPVEWDSPNPVSFLSIPPSAEFLFALQPRSRQISHEDVDLAKEFLITALFMLGIGAKTVAGFGRFKAGDFDVKPALPPGKRLSTSCKLVLSSPAFYAGAKQDSTSPAACTLRGSTLRGLLRYWWRTLYVGQLRNDADLRKLESLVWGGIGTANDDEASGSAVSISITPSAGNLPPMLLRREEIVNRFGLDRPGREARRTTGIGFVTFGMEDGSVERNNRKERAYLETGAGWSIRLLARPAQYKGSTISAGKVLEQALAAIWLLTQFGGSGSKARHGFGGLTLDSEILELKTLPLQLRNDHAGDSSALREDVTKLLAQAKAFAVTTLGADVVTDTPPPEPKSASLSWLVQPQNWGCFIREYSLRDGNVWAALDQVGNAKQNIAKKYKRNREKIALGLPRRLEKGGQILSDVRNPDQPREALKRHASPIHTRILGTPEKRRVRLLAFPSYALDGFATNSAFLASYLTDFEVQLKDTKEANNPKANPPVARPAPAAAPPSLHQSASSGFMVCEIVDDPKSGKWKARVSTTGVDANIANLKAMPPEVGVGQTARFFVANPADPQNAQATWRPEQPAGSAPAKAKKKGK